MVWSGFLTVAYRVAAVATKQPVVTVAGTNGKGSTIAVLEALISEADIARCFYVAHLLRFNERIRVAGVDASDAEIVHAFGLIDQARGSVSLTYFEFAALAALLIFEASELDFVISRSRFGWAAGCGEYSRCVSGGYHQYRSRSSGVVRRVPRRNFTREGWYTAQRSPRGYCGC